MSMLFISPIWYVLKEEQSVTAIWSPSADRHQTMTYGVGLQ